MHVAVSGASGLLGNALVRSLLADGHQVIRLVRREPRPVRDGTTEVRWSPKRRYVDIAALEGVDGLVNLAGAGIASRRWTAAYKKELRDSRVLGTSTLAHAAARLAAGDPDGGPRVLVNGSAVGYYGDTGATEVDESAPSGSGFLAGLCREWEAATEPAEQAGVRCVALRTGLVVSRRGGAWGRLFPLFKAGLGGRLGDGSQYWSFVSLHDHVAAMRHLLQQESVAGPVNLTAPHPATNREITATMGSVLHRPTLCTVPAPVLRLALGEAASDLLSSQRVVPRRLQESGFTFRHPTIRTAVEAAL